MISINRKEGYLRISRYEYLYRDGKVDSEAERKMGDGDILIALPDHMISTAWDSTGRSDGQNFVTIVEEIQRRLALLEK